MRNPWLLSTLLSLWPCFSLAAGPQIGSAENCFKLGMRYIHLGAEIEAPRDEVFDFYTAVNPADVIGRAARSNFEGEWNGLRPDLLYPNTLRYFLLKFPLDIKFTTIDRENYLIRFEYVHAPSTGFQEIQFLKTDEGATEISHNTCYQGNNAIINLFYPNVHKKVLRPMHDNAKFLLEIKASRSALCADESDEICAMAKKTPLELSKLYRQKPYRKIFRRLRRSASTARAPASLTPEEWADFSHLSEGSDIYPYDWWIRIKSARARDLTHTWNTHLSTDLDQRTGAILDASHADFVSPMVGASVTWSNHPPTQADARTTDVETASDRMGERPTIRWVGGEPSIRMIGPSCAACHTGSLLTPTHRYVIPGGNANISLDRFFRDMIISTLALTVNFENQLTEFLVAFNYPRDQAARIAARFKKQTLKQGRLGTKLSLLLAQLNVKPNLPDWFLIKEEANLAQRFKALLRLTLHLSDSAPLGNELERRMDFFAKFATGTPKWTYQDGYWTRFHETRAAYGRIDAFINAFNITLRDKQERVDISAPMGFPVIWGIENKKLIHQTVNTNSVLLRNVGQAMGGGAILLDGEWNSTVNIPNLHRLEKLMYKIDAPDWESMFAAEGAAFKIDSIRADRGHAVFSRQCAQCHLPQAVDNTHLKPLYEYPLLKHAQLGTDPELAQQIVKPVSSLEGPVIYPKQMYLLETRGIVDAFFKKYSVPATERSEYLFEAYRGTEWFRDTKIDFPESSYSTRDLAGIWASAPFLHNNSVPTLWDLLQPASKRPVVFKVGLQQFDPHRVGQLNSEMGLDDCRKPSRRDYKWDIYQCIDTRLRGNSNAGHEYGVGLSDEEKWDLIEYLKVLKPYRETAVSRGPSSVDVVPTPFLRDFDRIELRQLPLIGGWLERKDFLRHRLRMLNHWLLKDPVEAFAELRDYRPVASMSSIPIKGWKEANAGVILISKYDDVIEVMGDSQNFSVRHFGFKLGPLGGHMLATDNTPYNMVEKPWMRKLMPTTDLPRLQSLLESLTRESFDLAARKGTENGKVTMNLVRDLARRVPIRLSQEYFGYPGPDIETLYEWSYAMQNDTFHNPTNKLKIRKRALSVGEEMKEYSETLIEGLRAQLAVNGGKVIHDTILERMLLSPEVTTADITDDRVGVNILATLIAGVETVQAAVVNALEFLLGHPEQMEAAKDAARAGDMATLTQYVLESLRFNPINPMLIRYTEHDVTIAKGTERETFVPRGTTVFVGTQSAMLDPERINEPSEFRIDRPNSQYLTFGYGHHRCLGEMIATLEVPVMIKNLILKKNLRLVLSEDVPGMPFPEKRWIEFDVK